ncbi:transketolase [Micromonospora fluostatini]|uniref:Transketolase n=1 Tax=Micromonospora fluostatini TaxID=1629071 RepID=A0ABY2DEA7_9ACTN|nr:transketolase [Micromonospora fluostatini]
MNVMAGFADTIPGERDHARMDDESDLPYRLARIGRLATDVRAVVLEMIHRAGSGHVGSSLSCVDLVSVLKFDQMGPAGGGDVFVLSKGHAAPTWYAALMVSGELDRGEIGTLRRIDSRLQGHPDRSRLDLVDVSTGALGQGLSVALGRAQAKRLRGDRSTAYCLSGDGELQEGQMWEAVMYAGASGLSNVVLLVDHNRSQNDGTLDEVLPLHPLAERFRAFHWHVQDVNGHSHLAVRDAVINARAHRLQPSVIIAHTRKGYLGPGEVLLNGAHSGTLTTEVYRDALAYLGRVSS